MHKPITLQHIDGDYAVARLPADHPFPAWADGPGFVSISRTDDELSIVCRTERVPEGVQTDWGWICLKLVGPFAFDQTGIVLSVIAPVSTAGIGIFVVSTFDGDHLMVKQADYARACTVLREAGHRVDEPTSSLRAATGTA